MFRNSVGLLGVLLLGVACSSMTDTDPGGADAGNAHPGCFATAYDDLIGNPVSTASIPEGMSHRVIFPNSAVTTDFQPNRLNISVNEKGTVLRVSCG